MTHSFLKTTGMENMHNHVDDIMSLVGFGRWQITQSVLLFLFFLPWSNVLVSIVIVGFVPDFTCLHIDNGTSTIDGSPVSKAFFDSNCTRYNASTNQSEQCPSGFLYSEPKHASIVSEWDLVCGQSFLSEVSQSALTIGLTAGAVIFPSLSDRFGRRKIILVNHFLFTIASAATAFVPNIWLFIAFRIVIGALLSGTGMTSWVMALELFVPKYRTMAALLSNTVWAVCVSLLPMIGYLMDGQSWRHVQLIFSIYSLLWIAQFLKLRESVRWLLAKGRTEEALRIVKNAAQANKIDPAALKKLARKYFYNVACPGAKDGVHNSESSGRIQLTGIFTQARDSITKDNADSTEKLTRVSAFQIIKHPILRKVTAILACTWFTNSITYFGIYMLSSTMSGSRYLNLFLTSVVEIPSALFLIPLSLRFGRRTLCIAFYTMAGISLITAAILHVAADGHVASVLQTCVVVLGKFSITSSFMVIFMYTPELYPTSIRSVGLGLADFCSRTGGIIAPFAATVARSVPWVPACVFGALCLVVAFLCAFLPETANQELPQTLEDLEKLEYGKGNEKESVET